MQNYVGIAGIEGALVLVGPGGDLELFYAPYLESRLQASAGPGRLLVAGVLTNTLLDLQAVIARSSSHGELTSVPNSSILLPWILCSSRWVRPSWGTDMTVTARVERQVRTAFCHMYFPTGVARKLAQATAVADSADDEIVSVAPSPRKSLFCTVTRNGVSLWRVRVRRLCVPHPRPRSFSPHSPQPF